MTTRQGWKIPVKILTGFSIDEMKPGEFVELNVTRQTLQVRGGKEEHPKYVLDAETVRHLVAGDLIPRDERDAVNVEVLIVVTFVGIVLLGIYCAITGYKEKHKAEVYKHQKIERIYDSHGNLISEKVLQEWTTTENQFTEPTNEPCERPRELRG